MNVYFMKLDYLFANKALLFVACKRDLKPWDSFELRYPCLYNIIVINILRSSGSESIVSWVCVFLFKLERVQATELRLVFVCLNLFVFVFWELQGE